MNLSIRKYLLINLLFGVTVIIALTATFNYYFAQRDIQEHLDSLLSQSAFIFQALISDDLKNRNIPNLQKDISSIPFVAQNIFNDDENKTADAAHYHTNFQFQIWNKKGELLLHSLSSPSSPLSDGHTGYSLARIDDTPWRVFTLFNSKTGLSTIVAESMSKRAMLGRQITDDYLLIILFAAPLLGFIIWIIIGRGLAPLKRVTYEVSHRVPNYMEPVDLKNVAIEIKPLVEELNRLFLRLGQALDREKRFAGDAAHELKTPLAALKTQAQVALQCQDNDALKHNLKNIITAVNRSTHIVEQLLTLSRLAPEATEGLNDIIPIDLTKLVAIVVAELVPSAVEKKIEIELIADKKASYDILGNATSISILIRNLVDNAIRYTYAEGRIVVSIFKKDNHIVLRVHDNGPGIPNELHSRVFERFYRVLGNKSPGSGLGLAIVQHIANLHHATIALLTPEEGGGLIIDVSFPQYQETLS
jgi:two-component system, OmpR family, sensor histidine kinase QseC